MGDLDENIPLDPLSQGRSWYRSKNYPQALKAFTKAVNNSTGFILLTSLDNRAATFEKLDQLDKALKDALEMIRLKSEVSKGYLRAGKVLQLRMDDERALKIYERGLQKAKNGNEDGRILLQGVFNKLQKKLATSNEKFFDPLVKLPVEIAEMVCSYLDVRDRMLCLRVTKAWKRFLESNFSLWKELDISQIRNQITTKSLRAYFRRSNYSLTKAKIHVGYVESSKLAYLVRSCKQLHCLEFRQGFLGESLTEIIPDSPNLRVLRLGSDVEISLSSIVKVLRARPELQIVQFSRIAIWSWALPVEWPQLDAMTSLTLGGYRSNPVGVFHSLNLSQLIGYTPNLETLAITGWLPCAIFTPLSLVSLSKLKNLNISHNAFNPLSSSSSLPPSLINLDISYSEVGFGHPDADSPPADLPLLESLNCDWNSIMNELDVAWLINSSAESGTLKSLHIGNMTELGHSEVLPPCDSLGSLSLNGFSGKESVLAALIRKYPNLRWLNLSSTKVTGVLVREIMTREVGPLDFLGLVHTNKCSPDAIEWARSLGTEVISYTSPSGNLKEAYRDKMAGQY